MGPVGWFEVVKYKGRCQDDVMIMVLTMNNIYVLVIVKAM